MSDLSLFLDFWVHEAFEGVLEEVDECGGKNNTYAKPDVIRRGVSKFLAWHRYAPVPKCLPMKKRVRGNRKDLTRFDIAGKDAAKKTVTMSYF